MQESKGQGVSAPRCQGGPSGERTQPLNTSRSPPGSGISTLCGRGRLSSSWPPRQMLARARLHQTPDSQAPAPRLRVRKLGPERMSGSPSAAH